MRTAAAGTGFLLLLCACLQSQTRDRPGAFDYYVLSLSWSPQYCANSQNRQRDPEQCATGRRYAFVTHGLWPNNNRLPHPRNCAPRSPVPPALIEQMLSVMPSRSLIQHEWDAHGTCSGLTVEDYFAHIRTTYRLVSIPQPYRQPLTDLRVPAADLRRRFQQSNPNVPANGLRLDCAGQFLREIRICFDKQLVPRVCGSTLRDSCGTRPFTLRRVR